MSEKNRVTPDELFAYASRYARRLEAQDKGTDYPTLRQAANRFKVNYDDLEMAVEDFDSSKGYLGLAVGIRTGSGYGSYKHRGEWKIEAYV